MSHASPAKTDRTIDLDSCASEPIHLLGRVQSYGALLAVSSDWMVQHASVNLASLLGEEAAADPIGRPLGDILPDEAFATIRRRLRSLESGAQATRIFGVALHDRRFDVSIHQSGRHLVIEFEPEAGHRDEDALAGTYPLIQKVREADTLSRVAHEGARAVQALSGFDSVMVYQFQDDGSGSVIAESKVGASPSYLGLRFPASDIPAQARALYQRNLLRLIADIDDPGAEIVPGRSPEGEPLDLSLAVTRAVSPIHIEYLRNMNVAASMSVSIIKDGKLWGLFACHHRAPHYVPFDKRTAVELFAHLFSYELTRLQERARTQTESRMREMQGQLMRKLAVGTDLAESLTGISEPLDRIIPHDGLVLVSDGAVSTTGVTPTKSELNDLTRFLNTAASTEVYATDCLSREHAPARDYSARCSGILALPISRTPRDYLILCRREEAHTVDWAGAPDKTVSEGRLHPRKSFEAWQEIVQGQSTPWGEEALRAADMLRSLLLEVFLRISDSRNMERKRAQERQELLISELNHRVRNILNLMRGLISQSQRENVTIDRFAGSLDGRIQALARAHDQLTRKEWAPASLSELVRLELAAYVENVDRATVEGDDVLLAPDAYTALALVLHEMVTNSVKYGAMSDGNGHVTIGFSRDAAGALELDWRERGGPVVRPPERRGFGSAIIERSIPFELNGEAEIDYRATGVAARFRVPPRYLSEPENVVALQRVDKIVHNSKPKLKGPALVVEDAMIIAMDAADILRDFGASDVRIAANVAEGLREAQRERYEVAIIDVNLGGEQSVKVAEALAMAGVPLVVTTGYGERENLRSTFPPCQILQKPFSNESIGQALAELGFTL
ncbi:HWE histidine kinase domain-containing protein [Roseivivax sediminis]|uniref:histidine kinase n=1 Tax=Roseivivax sediminis TaxID=936889 RepID=A0A1I1VZ32_9RHOB|nr:HWE histidine kinase domain-containing protein [Roseivivax sediminis]SFD88019.1 Bacteriophytochrome (light-regulated signal transduction histidine kinase) [Roseivivax sediminis]